jgi:hypothetical protein
VSTVTPVPEDDLIRRYEAAQAELREGTDKFPRLVMQEVTDDDETYWTLYCPRCEHSVGDGDLYAISPAEHWAPNEYLEDDAFDRHRVTFDSSERPDLEETLYYQHGDLPGHAVSLPDGWKEDWS